MGLGRFNKPQLESRKAEFLTRDEAQRFLDTARDFCPDKYPFFLAALRTGLREGELVALQWEDVQLGESADGPNRYILVRRNYSHGQFTTPKSHKARKVDLNQELRSELLSWRDRLILRAFEQGKEEIPELVFPSDRRATRQSKCLSSIFPALSRSGRPPFHHIPCPAAFLRFAPDSERRESSVREGATGAFLDTGDCRYLWAPASEHEYFLG